METKVHKLSANETRHWAVRVGVSLLALGLAYIAGSLALDRGNPLYYLATLVLSVVGFRQMLLAIRDSWRRRRKHQA